MDESAVRVLALFLQPRICIESSARYGVDRRKGTMRNSAKPGMLADENIHDA